MRTPLLYRLLDENGFANRGVWNNILAWTLGANCLGSDSGSFLLCELGQETSFYVAHVMLTSIPNAHKDYLGEKTDIDHLALCEAPPSWALI